MRRIRLTKAARTDIKQILRRSETDFGQDIRERYKRLLDRAFLDVAADPYRHGAHGIDDVREGYFAYHIKWSKQDLVGEAIRRPRHLLVFHIASDTTIIVAAVIHERELLHNHLRDMP